jgi:hypothetical protein
MRMLYLPREGRTSPATEAALRRSIQDTIRVDPQSRMNAAFNPVVVERERLLGMLRRMDTRPWQADVRTPGSVDLAGEEANVPFDEMLFGLPTAWDLVETHRQPVSEIVTAAGQTLSPKDIDRAIRYKSHLLLQRGAELWQINNAGEPEYVQPAEYGVLPPLTPRQCLASLGNNSYDLLPAKAPERTEINHSLNGLSIETETTGDVEVEIQYVATHFFSSAGTYSIGDLTSSSYIYVVSADGYIIETKDNLLVVIGEETRKASIGDFLAAGRIIDDDGQQVPYTVDNIDNTITVDGPGTLYYNTRHVREENGQQNGTVVSFSDLSSRMFKYPSRHDISVYQRVDPLCEVPGQTQRVEVDRSGRVGEAVFSHPAQAVLPGLFHVLVAGNDADGYLHLSLVEHNTGTVRMTQRFEPRQVAGLTWTRDEEIALLEATDGEIVTHVISDVRNQQSERVTPSVAKRSSIPEMS